MMRMMLDYEYVQCMYRQDIIFIYTQWTRIDNLELLPQLCKVLNMIIYNPGCGIYQTLFRVHGSALYKGIVPASLSTALLLALVFAADEPTHELETRWFNHRT